MGKRLLYPDICKFIAIFLVTWSHCAQRVSGEVWNNFLGGMQLDIAFNMPMFMLISGWFLNLDKIRESSISQYVVSKFKRLIIPSVAWFLVHFIFALSKPGLSFFDYYWYLNALFICLCVILIFAKIFRNNILCCLFSIFFILALPYSYFSHVNFMFPFLWAGYGLHQIYNSNNATFFALLCSIIGIALCFVWNYTYTVYMSPLEPLHVDFPMVFAYLYRFAIGFTLSSAIIFLIMKFENKLCVLAHLGSKSLVIYTASSVLNEGVTKVLDHLQIHTNDYIIIDIVSLCICSLIVYVSILFYNYCKQYKTLSMLFLGE